MPNFKNSSFLNHVYLEFYRELHRISIQKDDKEEEKAPLHWSDIPELRNSSIVLYFNFCVLIFYYRAKRVQWIQI